MIVPVELMVGEKVLNDKNFAVGYIQQQIAQISNRKVEEIVNVSFPLGLRPLKVNTRFSFDGFEACVTGKDSGGKQISMSSLTSLKVSQANEKYIKKVERFAEKKEVNNKITLDEKYDEINENLNFEIYRMLQQKITKSCFGVAFGNLSNVFEKGENKFVALKTDMQCEVLLNIINVFKTGRSGTCNLKSIGGVEKAASYRISAKVSNWKKNYTCVKIIDESASGIFRKESENILEWL